jgi:predicted amidophosphoribosyltransferase
MSLGTLLVETAQLFWPARCAACNEYVPDEAIFCDVCAPSVNPLWGSCPGCALPLSEIDPPRGRCATCRRVPFPFVTALAGFEYGAALADAIVRMKHGGRRDLARRLARIFVYPLGRALARGGFGAGDAVVPVPLHPRKLRQRGFNQALELARGALALLGGRGEASARPARPTLERRLLLRTRDTRELGHAGPAARMVEVAGAFAVRDAARVRGRRVLLVDDVFTTGATFSECAGALRRAGAREVWVIALARAV